MPNVVKCKREATIYEIIASSFPIIKIGTGGNYTGTQSSFISGIEKYNDEYRGYFRINREPTLAGNSYRELLFTLKTVCYKCDEVGPVNKEAYTSNFTYLSFPCKRVIVTDDTMYLFCSETCKSVTEITGV